jgi:TRAP-type mannitol/chloroaromatic compound transport system substrate-binding protein
VYGGAELIAKRVAEITDDKFQIQTFAGGEIVPPFSVLDAVQNGTVEAGHTASYYYVGKDPTFAFFAAVPFGLNARQQSAWMRHGGGLDLMREFHQAYGVVPFMAGHTGAQMGGWFRKEVNKPQDLVGLKFRVGGFAGQVLQRLGVVGQSIPAGDIYPALERGTIDAAEWLGPYDDERLGLYRIAKYYYYPGFWEGDAQLTIYVGPQHWEALPKSYKAAFEAACAEASVWMLSKFDADNPAALRRLVANGTILKRFSREIMDASYKAAFELYDELATKNANFKKVYDPWKKFREEDYLWFRVAENSFDNFVYSQKSKQE